MAINPESLLIFKARGLKPKPEKKKVSEAKKKPIFGPKTKLSPLAKIETDNNIEPMVISQPQKPDNQKERQVAAPETKMAKESVQTAQTEQHQEFQAPAAPINRQPPPEKRGIFNFKPKAKAEKAQAPANPSVFAKQAASGNELPSESNAEHPRAAGKISKGQQSMEEAKGKACAWHPWRPAYAMCSYCKRPFCFQDTAEFNGEYYCLEDIDKVSSTRSEITDKASSSALNIVAGILLMAAFLVFIYFSNAQLIYITGYIHRIGLPFFLDHINYTYSVALAESALMILGLIIGMLLLVQSDKGFYIGMVVCLGGVALFSYQFLDSGTIYLGAVDAMLFLAFAMLLLSRGRYVPQKDEYARQLSQLESQMQPWPNTGRF